MTNDPTRIKIPQFDVDGIIELLIQKRINSHSRLYLKAVISEGKKTEYIQKATESITVSIEGEEALFSGLIEDINVSCNGDVYYLEIHAVSKSFLLDSEKKSRSFQESGMSYKAIAEELAKENKVDIKFEAKEASVENLLLQYEETNWEFLKRIASHNNSPLIPEALPGKELFYFGLPNGNKKGELVSDRYEVKKNLNTYRVYSKNESIGLSEKDAEEITVYTQEYLLSVGDGVDFMGKSLFVREVRMELKGAVLECAYSLVSQKGMSVPKLYNDRIIGLTLSAEVLEIKEDKLIVLLQVDQSQDTGKAYAFPFATPYTAEGNTGIYVMPEISDKVMVNFPVKDEKEAYAVTSYRKSGTGQTTDPDVRYFKTPHDKEVKVTKEGIYILTKTDELYIHLDQNKGIEILSKNPIKITTQDNLTVASDKDISISAKGNIHVTSGGDFKVHSEKMYTLDSKKAMSMESTEDEMKLTSKKNMTQTVSKDYTLNASGDILASSVKKVTMSAGKDCDITSGSKLNLSGSKKADMAAGGSSVTLDGNINLKAKLIKEN